MEAVSRPGWSSKEVAPILRAKFFESSSKANDLRIRASLKLGVSVDAFTLGLGVCVALVFIFGLDMKAKWFFVGFLLVPVGIWHAFLVPRKDGPIEAGDELAPPSLCDKLPAAIEIIGCVEICCGVFLTSVSLGMYLLPPVLVMMMIIIALPALVVSALVTGTCHQGGRLYRAVYPGDMTEAPPVPGFVSRYDNSKFKPSRGKMVDGVPTIADPSAARQEVANQDVLDQV